MFCHISTNHVIVRFEVGNRDLLLKLQVQKAKLSKIQNESQNVNSDPCLLQLQQATCFSFTPVTLTCTRKCTVGTSPKRPRQTNRRARTGRYSCNIRVTRLNLANLIIGCKKGHNESYRVWELVHHGDSNAGNTKDRYDAQVDHLKWYFKFPSKEPFCLTLGVYWQ